MKVALFCPRLPDEAESEHRARYQACRVYFRNTPHVDVMEFDNLEDLQRHYFRHKFRRIVVARLGYYPVQLTEWACRSGVSVTDAMSFPAAKACTSVQPSPGTRQPAHARLNERRTVRFA